MDEEVNNHNRSVICVKNMSLQERSLGLKQSKYREREGILEFQEPEVEGKMPDPELETPSPPSIHLSPPPPLMFSNRPIQAKKEQPCKGNKVINGHKFAVTVHLL